ncbi:MAG TPA: acetyl-CoA carboxylase biotin carboxyl carrier protein subunit [Nocardioidaceae bacterium]|nr:acetyl-CoA carboxylase biotin carboxyl carrier protein subunit [Nocardioidaceae bacterium]
MQLKVTVNGVVYDVDVEVEEEPQPTLGAIFMTGGSFTAPATASAASVNGGEGNGVRAPLSGTVARVLVEEGQAIEAGDVLVVLEAMKMETEITAPEAGTVAAVLVTAGDAVSGGQVLVELA